MHPIATYVFVDLETSSLPSEDNNRSKITELSLVAVKRSHVLVTQPGAQPRIQHKLTLCFNPLKYINPAATEVTGLCNDLLEHEPTFDIQVFTTINTFLNLLTKPVCLIAENGHNFDFPILKNHFEKLKVTLSDDILCADSLHAFYDIESSNNFHMISRNREIDDISTQETSKNNPVDQESSLDKQPTTKITSLQAKCETNKDLINVKDETDFYNPPKFMQEVNEVTPKCKKVEVKQISKVKKVRRKLFWGDNKKPSNSYKLKDLYMRVLNRKAVNAHRAEIDCILTLEVAVALGKDFVNWVDNNNCLFSDVKPMTIGVRLGE